jgi:transcriptional regulator with XRE-family HTH domain
MSKIGDRLRALIPDERGEQKAVAALAGVELAALNKILRGTTKEPGFETVAKIARALNVPLDALYDGKLPAAKRADVVLARADLTDLHRIATELAHKLSTITGRQRTTAVTPPLRPDVQSGSRSDEEQDLDRDRGDGKQE